MSFLIAFEETSPYEVIADEVDITIGEGDLSHTNGKTPALPSSAAHSRDPVSTKDSGQEEDREPELEIERTVALGEKDPRILRTLLTGLPSPSSLLWSFAVLALNLLLILPTLDTVYGRLRYPSEDISSARR